MATAGIVACGGGSATTSPLINPEPDDNLSTPTPVAGTGSVSSGIEATSGTTPGDKIIGAIVDSGYQLSHPELSGLPYQAREFAGTGTLEDNVFRHGTYVAQTLAGATVGATSNALLLLGKVADSEGRIYTDKIRDASLWALAEGARVLNYSLAPMYAFKEGDFVGQIFTQALTPATGKAALMVMSAGNIERSRNGRYDLAKGNISTQVYSSTTFFGGNNAYKGISLIVGAIDANGIRQPYSYYPGEIAEVQSRFLVAVAPVNIKYDDGTSPYLFNGTSATAPLVSAAAIDVLYQWPHLSGQEVGDILLTTADRSFSTEYARNNCGATANINCGLYFFGQGKLDAEKALTVPIGTPQLVTSSTVDGGGYAITGTTLMLPAAFGDAYEHQSPQTVVFDAYGRDFAFPISSLMPRTRTTVLRQWQGQADRHTRTYKDRGWAFQLTRQGGSHDRATVRLAVDGDEFNRFKWQQSTGRHFQIDDDPTPLLSLQGHPGLMAYSELNSFAWQRQIVQHAFEWRTTFGANAYANFSDDGPRAQRHEVWWHVRPQDLTRWSLGYSSSAESEGLMGHAGSGALSVDRSLAQSLAVRWEHRAHNGWRTFARAEFGEMQVLGQTEYLKIDRASTSLWHAGSQWTDGKHLLALSLSQPLRVDRARAVLNMPAGRSTDGTVIRQNQSLQLRPSGRETRWELSVRREIESSRTGQGHWGLNLVHIRDAGHVAGQNDWAAFSTYQRRW